MVLQTPAASLTTVSFTVDEIRRVTRAFASLGTEKVRVLPAASLHYAAVILPDIIAAVVKMMLFLAFRSQ